MAKKTDKRQEVPDTSAPPPRQPLPPAETVSTARIWVFWIGVALAVIAARTLNYLLPGISESVLERWVMLAFGAFLVVFLIRLK
ncbi:MAG: hypothetical protein HY550_10165 [Elusimicrobia bacterium]|nr:hypothetical protein [Elusimicrobiota bacterium]